VVAFIVQVPSNLGLATAGVERLGETLLANGLAERIAARRAGRVELPAVERTRDSEAGGTLNADAIRDYAVTLADALEPILVAGDFPLVLGGDCSILLGPMLALRRQGRFGLLHIDGHADFFQPEAEPKGEAASMDLALVTGYGPAKLTDIEGLAPLVAIDDAVTLGFRDNDDQRQSGSQPLPAGLLALDLAVVRSGGIEVAAKAAVDRLTRQGIEGFFIHLDVDVLDDALMPAVDYRLPGGLSREELALVLRTALDSRRAAGMAITIYNPALDADGSVGRMLTDFLVEVLG
jgi:arginase